MPGILLIVQIFTFYIPMFMFLLEQSLLFARSLVAYDFILTISILLGFLEYTNKIKKFERHKFLCRDFYFNQDLFFQIKK